MSDNTLYKRFLSNLVSVELRETYMILNESVIPNIKTSMELLIHTPFNEESYHTFYGNVKNIIESFFLYWTQVMHKNIETANGYLNPTESNRSLLWEKVLLLMEKTVNARTMLQNDFNGINSQFDVKLLENEFQIHLLKFQELLKQLENFDYQELQKFVNANISLALSSEHKILEFASHQFATFLIDNHKKILISLEENFKRVSRNIRSPTQQLQSPKENAFAVSNIEPEKNNVNDELKHWQRKLHEFLHIKNNLDKLEKVKDKLLIEEQQNSPQTSNENAILENSQKWEEFKKLEIEISKSILTFFCVEGANRLNHSDAIGSFFMDEYGHRVYSLNYGLNKFHTCGDYFVKVHEDARPYYDENGRYIMENNQKLYKAAPCCSAYKLDDWGIFIKDSDSGYPNQCKEEIKKSYCDTIKAIEKEFEKLKVKLHKKAAIYLWNSLGDILTKSLLDIAKRQPKNPLHYLAHTLLYYKYHKKSKDTPEIAEKFVPNTEAVFKTKTKTSLIEHHKPKAEDEYQEISAFYSNIAQQLSFNLFDQ